LTRVCGADQGVVSSVLVVVTVVGGAMTGTLCWVVVCSVLVVRMAGAGELQALASPATASNAAAGIRRRPTPLPNSEKRSFIALAPLLLAAGAQSAPVIRHDYSVVVDVDFVVVVESAGGGAA
jgi:hypothetical protein